MTILVWNTRGLNAPHKKLMVKQLVDDSHPFLVGLLETKIKAAPASRVAGFLGSHWDFISNHAHHYNGRILCWFNKCQVAVQVLKMGAQFIHLQCQVFGQGQILVTLVYASNFAFQRSALWGELQDLQCGLLVPWIVVGDFNCCHNLTEVEGGVAFHGGAGRELQQLFLQTELVDLRGRSRWFTWENKQRGNMFIRKKLDRVLVNLPWLRSFPADYVVFGEPGCSDHSPIIIQRPREGFRPGAPFRFFNGLLQVDGFMEMIGQIWRTEVSGFKAFQLMRKLRVAKQAIKEFSW